MVKSYCVKQRKQTECIEPSGYKTAKNNRLMYFCTCAECFITKTKFVKSQKGGALARKKGPSVTDKIAYVGSMVVNPTASWGALGRVLASQAYKGVKDNYDYYKSGKGVDIHKAIGMLPKPKSGWTLPGHKYTGPYNDLDSQVKYDPVTGEILEIYDKPTNKTDAIAMQHDVDYSVCKDDKKCKNKADRRMVKSLDSVPYNERQWGHWLARNMINTKQKLGLGVKKKKTKKKPGKKN